MTENLLTQATTDCVSWNKLATKYREFNNALKMPTEMP